MKAAVKARPVSLPNAQDGKDDLNIFLLDKPMFKVVGAAKYVDDQSLVKPLKLFNGLSFPHYC